MSDSRRRHDDQMRRSREIMDRVKMAAKGTNEVREMSVDASGVPEVPPLSDEVHDAAKPVPALSTTGSPNKARQTLDAHNVPSSLVEEISQMAAAFIPREDIVSHVATHFPGKQPHELNDIVLAAVSTAESKMPDTKDAKHAQQEDAAFKETRFDRAQASFEARKRDMLNKRAT